MTVGLGRRAPGESVLKQALTSEGGRREGCRTAVRLPAVLRSAGYIPSSSSIFVFLPAFRLQLQFLQRERRAYQARSEAPSFVAMQRGKRRRGDDDDLEIDEKPFQNHPTLYFDDGNIILRAGRTLFCVHKSLLSKHSVVFRDLFQQKHETFRVLSQIDMTDTREDLEALLNVVYDGL